MRTGYLPEPVLKRSVYRQLNMEISGAQGHYGADCVSTAEAGMVSTSCGPIPGSEQDVTLPVTAVFNALLAGRAEPTGLSVYGLLDPGCEEAELQRHMKQIARAAGACQMELLDVLVQTSEAVKRPQYIVTGYGKKTDGQMGQPVFRPGQELVVTKWIGLSGTASLAGRYEQELHGRYPITLIDRAKEFAKLVSVQEEARAISHFGSCAMHALSQGGIFTALWEMAERAGVGLEVDLKKIPVKQETIEICEYFDINPYCFYSGGALLVGTDRAEALTAQLAQAGIESSVIGRVTDQKERVILNGEDRRYLDRPQQEEWYRKLEETK